MIDYGVLARSYSTLDYEKKLRRTLACFFKQDIFDNLNKSQLHKKINDTLIKYYNGEEVLKYRIAKYFLKMDYVAAFEVTVKDSRADFLVINGDTKCFEIKSKIDTLNRLKKQIGNYKDVFEYNTVLIDEKHLSKIKNILPEYYGIWTFKGKIRNVIREASESPELNSMSQLDLFTKKELIGHFKISDRDAIFHEFNAETINSFLKEALKARYLTRWNFVRNNWDNILPIDLQFFFNTNIDPELIYMH